MTHPGRPKAVIDWQTVGKLLEAGCAGTEDMLRDDPIRNLTPIMDVIRYRDEDWQ